jgi:signal transduction histidine kinase
MTKHSPQARTRKLAADMTGELASLAKLAPVTSMLTSVYTSRDRLPSIEGGSDISAVSQAKGLDAVTVCDIMAQLEQLKVENALLSKQVNEQARELRAAQAETVMALDLKAQFIANVSHELRTPMSGVLGMAELLREMPLASDHKELVNYIYFSAAGLVDVVNSLLDFSRLQAGKLVLEKQPFSLFAMTRFIEQKYGELAQKKGLTFKISIAPAVPDQMLGDEVRIRQVLSCLVDNAVKFSKRGYVHVSAKVDKVVDRMVVLRFRVKDTGIGLDPADLEHVFEPFSQVDGSSTRRFGGVGLGLSICTKLAKLMSGSISVKSKTDQGSTFDFIVPLETKK